MGQHDVRLNDVFQSGVYRAGKNLAQIWCDTHKRYEWHWIATGGAFRETGCNHLERSARQAG